MTPIVPTPHQTDAEIAAAIRHQERLIRQALDALTQGYWLQAYAALAQAKAIEDTLSPHTRGRRQCLPAPEEHACTA